LELQRHPQLPAVYSQAAGLATFFLQGAGGRYREPLVRYLVDVYSGRATAESLAAETGKSYSELDAEYQEFLESLP
jgi:hypothetical protein